MGFFDRVAEKLGEFLSKLAKPLMEASMYIGLVRDVNEAIVLEVESEGGTGDEKLTKAVARVPEVITEALPEGTEIPSWIIKGGKLLIALIKAAVYILNAKKILQGIRPQDN